MNQGASKGLGDRMTPPNYHSARLVWKDRDTTGVEGRWWEAVGTETVNMKPSGPCLAHSKHSGNVMQMYMGM